MRTINISIDMQIKLEGKEYTKYHAKRHLQILADALCKALCKKLAEIYIILEFQYEQFNIWRGKIPDPSPWPKHSMLCDCRRCMPSFRSYHKFLRRELVWNKEGHLE